MSTLLLAAATAALAAVTVAALDVAVLDSMLRHDAYPPLPAAQGYLGAGHHWNRYVGEFFRCHLWQDTTACRRAPLPPPSPLTQMHRTGSHRAGAGMAVPAACRVPFPLQPRHPPATHSKIYGNSKDALCKVYDYSACYST